MNKSLILNRIKLAYSLKNDAELARFLEIQRNTLSNWYSRNTLDYDKVFLKCELLNFDWLLTGQGEMFKEPAQSITSSSQSQENDNEIVALLKDKITSLEKINVLQERENAYQVKEIQRLEKEIQRLGGKKIYTLEDKIENQRQELIAKDNEILALKSPGAGTYNAPISPERL